MALEHPAPQQRGDEDMLAAFGAAMVRLLTSVRGEGVAFSDAAGWSAPSLAREGARLVPGSGVAVCSIEGSSRSMTVVATSDGPLQELGGSSWPRRGSLVQRALESRVALETTDLSSLHGLGDRLQSAGVGTVRAVPLMVQADPDGAPALLGAYLATRPGGAEFTDSERRRIDAFAPVVALTLLYRVRQLDQETQARQLSLAVDIAVDLASAVTPADVNHRILVRTVDAVDADRATLIRLDRDDLIVEDAFDRDGGPQTAGLRVPIRDYPAIVRALATRKPERLTREMRTHLPEAPGTLESMKHSLVTPLVFAGEVVGLISLHRRRERDFSEAELQTLGLINTLAVLALRNSRLYADAQAARGQMSEFLDIVVHDLRSPLTVVSGYCSMMRDGIFGSPIPAWSRPLEVIEGKIREAQRLVDELLLAARLEGGDIPTQEQPLELGEVARAAVSRAEPQAQLDHATIVARPRRETVWARADRAHTERVIDNLVNNALAYGGSPADIEVAVIDGDAPGIAVTDHGPGIPQEQRDRIFDRFFRGHEGVQGSGLGLYVSRRLAEANDGSLDLDTRFAGGTRFVLRLPSGRPAGDREPRRGHQDG